MDVHHVDLSIGIAGIDSDVNIDFATVVAGRYREAIQHDSKRVFLGNEFEAPFRLAKPVEIVLRGAEVPTAVIRPFRLVEWQGHETLYPWMPQVDLLIGRNPLRLSALDLKVYRELLWWLFPGVFKQLSSGWIRIGYIKDPFVDLNLILTGLSPLTRAYGDVVVVVLLVALMVHICLLLTLDYFPRGISLYADERGPLGHETQTPKSSGAYRVCPQKGGSSAYREDVALGVYWMPVVNREIVSSSESANALRGLSEADLRRLERIARLRTIGLNDLDWRDLFHDAVTRLLDGSRRWPRSLSLVVFLRETMRSIASDHWRRRSASRIVLEAELPRAEDGKRSGVVENAPDLTTNPERKASAAETLASIEEVFLDDPEAMLVIVGMANGKAPNDIQEEADMNPTRYATTQRRIRRKLARAFPDRGLLQ